MSVAQFFQEGEGRVDFWVSPLDWAFELLHDGKELPEHGGRFDLDGNYSKHPWGTYGWDEYAVLDFRSASAASRSGCPGGSNAYVVCFADDFSAATLTKAATGESQTLKLAP